MPFRVKICRLTRSVVFSVWFIKEIRTEGKATQEADNGRKVKRCYCI